MIELIVLEGLSPWDDGTPAINVQYLRDGKLITGHYRPATKAQIDAAASPQMREDAAAFRVLESLGDDYKVTNDGLQGGWEVIRYYGSFQHQHYEGETLLDALRAAKLLPKEG